ncbi:MAG: CDP-alcohol phosphatidyltransferase family protein [Saprospiraceae bacterium]
MLKQVPNALTLLNLFGGCLAILAVIGHQDNWVIWLILFCNAVDFMDGFIARKVGADGPLGRELDSLADVVSFGVVPGMIFARLLADHYDLDLLSFGDNFWKVAPAFLLSVFAAYRLAKFNLDTRQSDEFLGLPVPACTMFVAGLLVLWGRDSFGLAQYISNPWFVYIMIAFLSWMMISEVPLLNLKVKKLSWEGNELRIVFLLLSGVLAIAMGFAALAPVILLYILLSIFRKLFFRP